MARTHGLRVASVVGVLAVGVTGYGVGHAHPQTVATCTTRTGPHVTVVVEVSPTQVLDRCVPVRSGTLSAQTVMRRSGIEMAVQHYSFGDAVCQLDDVPKAYSQCLASGRPYWALFVAPVRGRFRAATTGISGIRLRAGEALGWHYVPATGPDTPPPLPRRR